MIFPRSPSSSRTSHGAPRGAGGHPRSQCRVDGSTHIEAGLPRASHGRCRTRQRHRPGLHGCHEPMTVRRRRRGRPEGGNGAGRRGCLTPNRTWLSSLGPCPAGPATHPIRSPFRGQPWPPAVAPPLTAAAALAATALAAAALAEIAAAEPAASAAVSGTTTDSNAAVAAANRARRRLHRRRRRLQPVR